MSLGVEDSHANSNVRFHASAVTNVYHLADSNAADVVKRWAKLTKSAAFITVAENEGFLSRLFDHLRKEPYFKRAIEP